MGMESNTAKIFDDLEEIGEHNELVLVHLSDSKGREGGRERGVERAGLERGTERGREEGTV